MYLDQLGLDVIIEEKLRKDKELLNQELVRKVHLGGKRLDDIVTL